MKYHLIAIGGSIMHNLAIDLKDLGHQVSGSDDEIFEPSRSRLEEKGLLPSEIGWKAERITEDIDTVILGKHAKEDNPELQRALDLGLTIKSFPEFITQMSKAKTKIAITGSHGKTSTTAIAMFVMSRLGIDFDYLVGAQIEGFSKMVKMSGADILIVEGDEYPSSCLDNRAKMIHYDADISVVTGVAWDHVNIYKTYEDYLAIFDTYLKMRTEEDLIFFDQTDKQLLKLVAQNSYSCKRIGYFPLEVNNKGDVIWEGTAYPIKVFGEHNLKNLNAARLVCEQIGIQTEQFLGTIKDFTGAAKRLQLIPTQSGQIVYKDFAHAPSKAKATANAVRSSYKSKKIRGVLELHTFSSLSMPFIEHYRDSLSSMDEVKVFFDPHALQMKGLPDLDRAAVQQAFNHPNLEVVSDSEALKTYFSTLSSKPEDVILIMSSGNLGGVDLSLHF